MSSGILYFNDIDAYDLGFDVQQSWRGILGSSPRQVSLQGIAGRAGGIASGYFFPRDARIESIPGFFRGATAATLQASWRTVQQELQSGVVRIRTAHDANLEWEANWLADNLANRDGAAYDLALTSPVLTFQLPCPFGRDTRGPFTVGFDSTARDIPGGTAPCRARLEIFDATNPTITYLNSASNVIATLGLTVTHSVGLQSTIVDLDTREVTYINSGTPTNGYAQITSGDFFNISALDHGNYRNSQWPKLKISSGYGVLTYDKFYV